eukprot:5788467-Pyramimonas_sp.AAC.1
MNATKKREETPKRLRKKTEPPASPESPTDSASVLRKPATASVELETYNFWGYDRPNAWRCIDKGGPPQFTSNVYAKPNACDTDPAYAKFDDGQEYELDTLTVGALKSQGTSAGRPNNQTFTGSMKDGTKVVVTEKWLNHGERGHVLLLGGKQRLQISWKHIDQNESNSMMIQYAKKCCQGTPIEKLKEMRNHAMAKLGVGGKQGAGKKPAACADSMKRPAAADVPGEQPARKKKK